MNQTEFQKFVTDRLDEIYKTLNGNGQPGFKVRIDRLERSNAERKWLLRVIAGAVIVAAVRLWMQW